jgi:hypothetical protein
MLKIENILLILVNFDNLRESVGLGTGVRLFF